MHWRCQGFKGGCTSDKLFPGQYFDKETGLHYNYYRTYDPSLGRYIQSDPIGILEDYSDPQLQVALLQGIPLAAGGSSPVLNHLYGYANQNPLSYVDPFGLSPGGSSGGSDSGKQCDDKKDKKDKCKPPKWVKGLARAAILIWCLLEDRRPPPPPPRPPIPPKEVPGAPPNPPKK